jgi:hypothetical protein
MARIRILFIHDDDAWSPEQRAWLLANLGKPLEATWTDEGVYQIEGAPAAVLEDDCEVLDPLPLETRL